MATTTATERRQQAKQEYDAFLAECPTRQLLESLTDKWMGLVLGGLGNGPKRHSELSRRIAGVSQKMLTQTLRTLERDGLIPARSQRRSPCASTTHSPPWAATSYR